MRRWWWHPRLMGLVAAGAAVRAVVQRARAIELHGLVALVTGGSRGLGLLMARELAREGCKLVLCARDQGELESARQDLAGRGAEVLALPCDVGDPAQVELLVTRARDRFGRVDVLVNNASIIQVGPLESMSAADFDRALCVNFWGVLHTTLAVLPEMRSRHSGRIVNITSIGGKVAVPHLLPYDCAKFASLGLSEGLRAELAKDGVVVTTIVPGLMRTGSPLRASFRGRADAEFVWFGMGDALPLTSMDAERAAARIVRALRRGEAEVTLTWQAKLLRLAHDLMPGLVVDLLGLVNRFLPAAPATATRELLGVEAAVSPAATAVADMLRRPAEQAQQLAEPAHPETP